MTTNGNGDIKVTFLSPRDSRQFPVAIGPALTGEKAIVRLVEAKFLEPAGSGKAYALQHDRTAQTLPLSESLVASGVTEGDAISVIQVNQGAARLSAPELRGRLAFDYQVMRGLRSPALGRVRAFASLEDANRGKELADADGDRGGAKVYEVEYRFPILVGPTRTVESATARYQLLAGSNYPFSAPDVQFLTRPLPWTPHVHPSAGWVCIGAGWSEARGKMLAAQLAIHLMHLLNFDEPEPSPDYSGWNGAAISHWRTVLRYRPRFPDLVYPVLPSDVTHGLERADEAFRPVAGEEPTFEPVDFAPIRRPVSEPAFRIARFA